MTGDEATLKVIDVLETLRVSYVLVGSFSAVSECCLTQVRRRQAYRQMGWNDRHVFDNLAERRQP